jgi:hypothetical protein
MSFFLKKNAIEDILIQCHENQEIFPTKLGLVGVYIANNFPARDTSYKIQNTSECSKKKEEEKIEGCRRVKLVTWWRRPVVMLMKQN